MRRNISKAQTIGNQLYGRYDSEPLQASQYAYNLFGEEQTLTEIHEGSDYAVYEGAGIHSVSGGGVVTSIIDYSGGKVVAVYHANYNKTVLYIHVKNPVVSVGMTISENQRIASQGRYVYGNINNTHTHVEVVAGKRTNGNPGKGANIINNQSDNLYTWVEFL